MKREMPKVLMLASVASMVGQFNMHNIRLLQEMGYEVHVACNFKEGNTFGRVHSDRLWQLLGDLRVVRHQWDCPRRISSAARCVRAYRQLWELTGRYHFEWMHCHSPIGGALARIAAHLRGIRVIYTAHGFHFYIGAPVKNWLLYYPVEKLLSYWTDVLVTVNREDCCLARQYMRARKVCYIPGIGIESSRFQTKRGKQQSHDRLCSTYHIPQEAVVILSVGELNKGKNHQIVISALAGLLRQDVYYLICGQGSLKKELQQYADSLGVGSRLRMPGYQEDMPQIYQGADLFVFPSLREGMPVALMEAMAAGLPCVVSDIRGNRELIGSADLEGCAALEQKELCAGCGGIRYAPDDHRQLQRSLELLLEDEQLRTKCGMRNQRKILKYDRAVVEKRMKRIYDGAAEPKAKPEERNHAGKAGTVKVSVIVPVYNAVPYLRECMDSLIQQSLSDLEIICVDDGSTDESSSMLLEYAAQDSRIRVIQKKNTGYGHTMNVGIEASSGEYIGIVEPDDLVLPDMYRRLYQIAAGLQLDIIKADFYQIRDSAGTKKQERRCLAKKRQYYGRVLDPGRHMEIFQFVMNTWAGIYRRDFLETFHIRHNETPGASYQDLGFWFQTFCQAKRVYFLNEPFYRYRLDNPASSIHSRQKVYSICAEYAFIYDFLNRHPELKERYLYIYHWKKFHDYQFAMGRIGEEYRSGFLKRFSLEFREAEDAGELDKSYFESGDWRMLQQIINAPERFLAAFVWQETWYRVRYYLRHYGLKNTLIKLGKKAVHKAVQTEAD